MDEVTRALGGLARDLRHLAAPGVGLAHHQHLGAEPTTPIAKRRATVSTTTTAPSPDRIAAQTLGM
jgi:hypothetical protein